MFANVSGAALTDLSAPGIVTGWPRRPASSCAGRLGETHRLSRDGGSSRARPPERRGRKDSNLTCIYQLGWVDSPAPENDIVNSFQEFIVSCDGKPVNTPTVFQHLSISTNGTVTNIVRDVTKDFPVTSQ